MTLTAEQIALYAGILLTLGGLYAIFRARITKETNMERDIKELKDRVGKLEDHYKEMLDRLYDNLFPKRK